MACLRQVEENVMQEVTITYSDGTQKTFYNKQDLEEEVNRLVNLGYYVSSISFGELEMIPTKTITMIDNNKRWK